MWSHGGLTHQVFRCEEHGDGQLDMLLLLLYCYAVEHGGHGCRVFFFSGGRSHGGLRWVQWRWIEVHSVISKRDRMVFSDKGSFFRCYFTHGLTFIVIFQISQSLDAMEPISPL